MFVMQEKKIANDTITNRPSILQYTMEIYPSGDEDESLFSNKNSMQEFPLRLFPCTFPPFSLKCQEVMSPERQSSLAKSPLVHRSSSLGISISSSDPSFTPSHGIILLTSYISFLLLALCLIYLILSLLGLIPIYIPHLSFH